LSRLIWNLGMKLWFRKFDREFRPENGFLKRRNPPADLQQQRIVTREGRACFPEAEILADFSTNVCYLDF